MCERYIICAGDKAYSIWTWGSGHLEKGLHQSQELHSIRFPTEAEGLIIDVLAWGDDAEELKQQVWTEKCKSGIKTEKWKLQKFSLRMEWYWNGEILRKNHKKMFAKKCARILNHSRQVGLGHDNKGSKCLMPQHSKQSPLLWIKLGLIIDTFQIQ